MMTFVKAICKKLSNAAPVEISNAMQKFKNDLRKYFYEKLESSDGQIRIEIILNRGPLFVEKIWFDFKKIRFTKNRLYKIAKYNHTKDLPIMKFHRHVKKIECALTVNRNFCQNNADFGNNVSDLLRELIRFLAAEEVQNIKVKINLDLKIWKIPNKRKLGKLVSAKYLTPIHSPFFTMWTRYRIETKIKNDEKSLPSSPATVVGYYVWNQELSKYEISKEKYNADLEDGYIETSIDRSQNKF